MLNPFLPLFCILSVPLWLKILAFSASVRSLPVGWRLIAFRFAFSAASSLTSAAAAPQLARGGHTGAIRGTQRHQPSVPRCNCINSAALAEPAAGHFSGFITQFALSVFLCVSVV